MDNIKVTGKITTKDLEALNGKVTNGIHSKYFALTGENYNNKELGKKGVFCNRMGNVAILHKGIFDITEPNKDHWMHINTKDETIKMNYKTLHLNRLLSYNNIAGYVVRNVNYGMDSNLEADVVILQAGKHTISDCHRPITSIHLFKGWKLTLWKSEKAYNYENKTNVAKHWDYIRKTVVLWNPQYQATWIGF